MTSDRDGVDERSMSGMRTSTLLPIVAAVFFVAVAAAIGFLAGRTSVTNPPAMVADRSQTSIPLDQSPAADWTLPANPRADLLRALERPVAERNQAIRVAMNAWLATDGAAAVMAVRDDPQLGDLASRMTQFALFAYPEIFVDHPSLLEDVPDARESIAMAARAIVMFDPDAARGMLDTHLSGPVFRNAVLQAVNRIERAERDPRAELESILAERDRWNRLERLFELMTRVASDDPVSAAELIDDMPAYLVEPAIQVLVEVWSRAEPGETARWLVQKDADVSGEGLSQLAQVWGQSDFEAASAFADTLTGTKRAVFLTGLASATHRMSNDDLLAWVSRHEGDPAYPNLIMSVAERFTSRDPEAAVAFIDQIGNASARNQTLPMIAGTWAQNDAESALDWALRLSSGPVRDRALAAIGPSLMHLDVDRALDAISEIEDPEVRKGPVRQLLFMVESDEEAIRLGRDYGFDRDAVLELRENRNAMYGSGFSAPVSTTFQVMEPSADTDEEGGDR